MDKIEKDIFGKVSEDELHNKDKAIKKQKRKAKEKEKRAKKRAKKAEKEVKSLRKKVKNQDRKIQELSDEARRENERRHESEMILSYIRGRFDSTQASTGFSEGGLLHD